VADNPADMALLASEARTRVLATLFLQDAAQFGGALKRLAEAHCSIEIPITGHSMGEALPDGTLARVCLGDGASCRVGDIAIFRQGTQLVAHRVLYQGRRGRAASHLITRGDARIAPDRPVPFARVLGRVTGIVVAYESLPPPRRRTRRWPVRVLNATLLWTTVLLLHVSPALAVRSARLLTMVERWLAAWSPWQRGGRAWQTDRVGPVLTGDQPLRGRLPWVE